MRKIIFLVLLGSSMAFAAPVTVTPASAVTYVYFPSFDDS